LPESWTSFSTSWQTCIGGQCDQSQEDNPPQSNGAALPELQPVQIAATAEPNNSGVSITWILPPTIVSNYIGSFIGRAIFNVPKNSNGLIIQQVTIGSNKTYWEAWTVTSGEVVPMDVGGGNDVFSGISPADSPESGLLQFYPLSGMSSFPELNAPNTEGWAPPSQSLYSTYTQPESWTPIGALPHQIIITPTSSGFSITGTPQ
jgi:hypothetical protein